MDQGGVELDAVELSIQGGAQFVAGRIGVAKEHDFVAQALVRADGVDDVHRRNARKRLARAQVRDSGEALGVQGNLLSAQRYESVAVDKAGRLPKLHACQLEREALVEALAALDDDRGLADRPVGVVLNIDVAHIVALGANGGEWRDHARGLGRAVILGLIEKDRFIHPRARHAGALVSARWQRGSSQVEEEREHQGVGIAHSVREHRVAAGFLIDQRQRSACSLRSRAQQLVGGQCFARLAHGQYRVWAQVDLGAGKERIDAKGPRLGFADLADQLRKAPPVLPNRRQGATGLVVEGDDYDSIALGLAGPAKPKAQIHRALLPGLEAGHLKGLVAMGDVEQGARDRGGEGREQWRVDSAKPRSAGR